jgi:hypothetical protein
MLGVPGERARERLQLGDDFVGALVDRLLEAAFSRLR